MKKNNYYIVLLFVFLVSASGCQKQFDENTPDPNNPVTVPPYLVLRQILNDMIVYPFDDADKFCQYVLSSYTYYGTNEYWTGSANLNYGTLRNVVAMEKEARRSAGDKTPYSALAKFFKAYFFYRYEPESGGCSHDGRITGFGKPDSQNMIRRKMFSNNHWNYSKKPIPILLL
jgi:hypothetical protein